MGKFQGLNGIFIIGFMSLEYPGNVIEIANYFGGAEKLREAVNELQTLLYAGF